MMTVIPENWKKNMSTRVMRNGLRADGATKSLKVTLRLEASDPSEATFRSVSSLVTSHCFPLSILSTL